MINHSAGECPAGKKLSLPDRLQELRDEYKDRVMSFIDDDDLLDDMYNICDRISQLRHILLSQQEFVSEIMTGLRNNVNQKGVYINAPTFRGHVDVTSLPTLEMLTAYDDALLHEMGIRSTDRQ